MVAINDGDVVIVDHDLENEELKLYPGARGYLFSPGLNIPSGEIGVVFWFTFHT